jgi:anti-anti-sigma factor
MSDGATLDISRTHVEGIDVVAVEGEVDLTNADGGHDAVVATSAPTVVLDLTAGAYLDSSGIRAIDQAHRQLASGERSLLIVSPPETPSDWTLRVAGFNRAIVLESVDAAVASAIAQSARS